MARNLTLMTDLYELTMMQGYFKEGKNNLACFDAFYRENPSGGGYAVCAGLEQMIDYIKDLKFTEDDIEYLRGLGIFEEDFLRYLEDFKFTGNIYAVPEGTIVFPREPLVKVVAPIIEAQLLETTILNLINHQTLIATKAARVVNAAKGGGVMEFGLRRAQGPDAGIYGARAAVIGGCVGTSCVMTAKMFGIPAMGTHAHSWIMSFESELEAFRKYAQYYPGACTLLVDTYDALHSGIPNAIKVFGEMRDAGIKGNIGIRIDSGDLAYLTKKARVMLDEAGFPEAKICASSDLDEYLISDLLDQGACVDSWGVGTNLITSRDCPSLGGVYKLAAIKLDDGTWEPKIKRSENPIKITNPGLKKILRVYTLGDNGEATGENAGEAMPGENFGEAASEFYRGKIIADIIALEGEEFDSSKDLKLFDPVHTWKKTSLKAGTYMLRELLEPIFIGGECVYESPSLMEIKNICHREMDTLWEESKRLKNPHEVYVDLSDGLYRLKTELLENL